MMKMLVVFWANNTLGDGEVQAKQRGCPCLCQLARHAAASVRRRHPARPLCLALGDGHEGRTLRRMFDPVTRNAAWARRGKGCSRRCGVTCRDEVEMTAIALAGMGQAWWWEAWRRRGVHMQRVLYASMN